MPIYQYKCLDCKTIFEELILNEKQIITCLNCSGKNIKKIPAGFSAPQGGKNSGCGGGCCGNCQGGCHR